MAVDYSSFTVKTLQDLLRARGQVIFGGKAELVARLTYCDAQDVIKRGVNDPPPAPSTQFQQ